MRISPQAELASWGVEVVSIHDRRRSSCALTGGKEVETKDFLFLVDVNIEEQLHRLQYIVYVAVRSTCTNILAGQVEVHIYPGVHHLRLCYGVHVDDLG